MRYGLELPEAMRPILEAMLKAGTLTDDTGVKMDDLSRLTFAADLTKQVEDLVAALRDLIEVIKGVPDVDVGVNYTPNPLPTNPSEPVPPTTPLDPYYNTIGNSAFATSGSRTTIVQVDGREIARAVTEYADGQGW
jgi:hypothetical protein